jgi:hypothetical protein
MKLPCLRHKNTSHSDGVIAVFKLCCHHLQCGAQASSMGAWGHIKPSPFLPLCPAFRRLGGTPIPPPHPARCLLSPPVHVRRSAARCLRLAGPAETPVSTSSADSEERSPPSYRRRLQEAGPAGDPPLIRAGCRRPPLEDPATRTRRPWWGKS